MNSKETTAFMHTLRVEPEPSDIGGNALIPLGNMDKMPPPPFVGIKYTETDRQYPLTPSDCIQQKIYIGIDPGKSGGIVALGIDGKVIGKWVMPSLGDNVDVSSMYDLFKTLSATFNVTVVLEDVHSIFGMSAATNFVFGYVCGAIEAVVLCLKLKLIKIAPKTWQKEIWSNGDKVYKAKKAEQKNPSNDTKATSLCAVTRLFPREDLRGEIIIKHYSNTPENRKLKRVGAEIPTTKNNPLDGLVDALLLAEYGRRKNL